MPEVTFYVLPTSDSRGRLLFVCRLLEKLHRENLLPVYVTVADDVEAQQLDDLLWTFRQGSFVPHRCVSGDADIAPEEWPILIGQHLIIPTAWRHAIVVNLALTCPDGITDCPRLLEIVDDDPAIRQAGRERFRHYRGQGWSIKTHHIE